jgi:diadenosine tetraphosphate (Ap4A) HIT family hydrolase
VLNETKNTISFLSIDFPAHEEDHMLVIPKKHFEGFENIPQYILNELIMHLSIASRITKKSHEGYNILLNNSRCAGQYIMRSYFHVIPRDEKDGINIESWKNKRLSLNEFKNLATRLKKEFSDYKKLYGLKKSLKS